MDSTDYLRIRKIWAACPLVSVRCPLRWLLVRSAVLDSFGVRPEHQKLPLMRFGGTAAPSCLSSWSLSEIAIFQQLPPSPNIQSKYVHALLGGYAFKFLHE